MTVFRTALCVMGAMIGAGFASGREIAAFFSRYGALSWPLCVVVGLETGALTALLLTERKKGIPPKVKKCADAVWILLYLLTAACMTAAAGSLWALTLPIPWARQLGGGVTLLLCAACGRRPLRVMESLSRGLAALLLTGILLSFRLPAEEEINLSISAGEGLGAFVRALGYGGMNAALSAGILREAGKKLNGKQKWIAAVLCGLAAGGLIVMENALLLRHAATIQEAAMPMVLLLRAFGKPGYFLSAAALYLAVMTTLISVCAGFRQTLRIDHERRMALGCAAILCLSSVGFEEIVDRLYPILGWLCFLPMLLT